MKIKLSKWLGDGTKVKREDWRDLVSSLVFCGYEVYVQDDYIVFELGDEDVIELDKEYEENSDENK